MESKMRKTFKSLALAALVAVGTISVTANSYAGGYHGGGGWRGGGGHGWNGGGYRGGWGGGYRGGYYRGGNGWGWGVAAGLLGLGVGAALSAPYYNGYYAQPYACYPNGYCGGVPRYYNPYWPYP